MERSSSRKFKFICLSYGPFLDKASEYINAANNLEAMLVAQDINMIYGGGNMNLLGCVVSTAKLGGCTALGIIPKAFVAKKLYGVTLGCELTVVSLHEKMGNILNNADALIALLGGLGILERIFNTSFWAQFCLHQKLLRLLNVNGFYDGLLSFIDHAVEQEFIKPVA